MIPFFRRIRMQLAHENKSAKYLRYAIGEIVLVVVGILIALSINNWNEEQKEKKILQNIYEVVAKDLKNDIDDINRILKAYETLKPQFDKVLNEGMSKNDYLECPTCLNIIMGFPDLSLDVRGYNLLKNYKNTNKKSEDSLTADISQFYTKRLNEINLNEKLRIIDLQKNYDYWKNNYSWFSDFATRKNSEGFLEYAVNSQDYKNRVASFYILTYGVLLKQYSNYNKSAQILIIRIENNNND